MSALKARVPEKLEPLLAPRRYKGAHGGRGGAKSHFFAEQIIVRCFSQPTRVVCVREIQNSIRDSVRQLLIDKIERFGLTAFFDVTNPEIRGANGSLIIFRGMQDYNADNIKSLEGYDIAWVEEAQTLSQRSLDLLRPTIRNEGSELWFSWNPRNKTDPVDKFFRSAEAKSDPDISCVEVSWRDNPWFPDVLEKERKRDYERDLAKARHIWDGAYEVITDGAYYAKLLFEAEEEGRIKPLGREPRLQVYTAWDLGIGDSTAIWFAQQHMGEIRLIDYYEASGVALSHYASVLSDKKVKNEWTYAEHILPHDAAVADLSTGKTRIQVLAELGITCRVLNREGNIDDGIAAVRMMLPRCWFDSVKCERGIEALKNYRTEYDDKLLMFKNRPLHNWASHGADAFRYLARGLPDQSYLPKKTDRYSRKVSGGRSWMSC